MWPSRCIACSSFVVGEPGRLSRSRLMGRRPGPQLNRRLRKQTHQVILEARVFLSILSVASAISTWLFSYSTALDLHLMFLICRVGHTVAIIFRLLARLLLIGRQLLLLLLSLRSHPERLARMDNYGTKTQIEKEEGFVVQPGMVLIAATRRIRLNARSRLRKYATQFGRYLARGAAKSGE